MRSATRVALLVFVAMLATLGGRCDRRFFLSYNGTLYYRGKPLIPTGVYFWPDHSKPGGRNPFEDIANYGLDTLVAYYQYVRPDRTVFNQPDLAELRVECARLGIHYFVGAPDLADLQGRSDAQLEALFAATSDPLADSAMFVGWMFDEPIWNGIDLALMTRAAQAIRRALPGVLIWINFAPVDARWGSPGWPDMASYASLGDIAGFDFYPVQTGLPWVGTISRFRIEDFAWYVDQTRSWVGPHKPVWMLQQAFRSGDFDQPPSARGMRPDAVQTRFMSFDALAHGASGLFYFPGSRLIFPIPLDDPTWDLHVRDTAAAIAGLGADLASPEIPEGVQVSSPELRILVRRRQGRSSVIAVREAPGPPLLVDFQLDETVGGLATVYGEGRSIPVIDGRFSDVFDGYAVHVYQME